MWKVQLFKLNFDQRERDAADAVIDSGWLTMGERTVAFESAFDAMLGGGAKSTAVANGTAALHMALLALGIGPGDDVVIPALTFVADANSVRMVGARPVIADCSSLDDWNMSVATIERALTPATRAVMVVHYAGYPCDMPAIAAFCAERGLALIEDVAHAPGAEIGGRRCGTWGDIGCFSFFSNKNLSVGEGGMVSSCRDDLHQKLRHLRSHGMTTLTLDRHMGRAISYDVAAPGLNYRMDEIRAAIGLVQLDKLEASNRRREQLTRRYRDGLSGLAVRMPFATLASSARSAYHILPVMLPESCSRLAVIESLKAQGIQSSIHYPPFWGFTAYAGLCRPEQAPLAAAICEHELTLPLFPGMRDDEVDLVVAALKAAL